jgi:hypothetical protein
MRWRWSRFDIEVPRGLPCIHVQRDFTIDKRRSVYHEGSQIVIAGYKNVISIIDIGSRRERKHAIYTDGSYVSIVTADRRKYYIADKQGESHVLITRNKESVTITDEVRAEFSYSFNQGGL